jgi:hypothetical protein
MQKDQMKERDLGRKRLQGGKKKLLRVSAVARE